jgi:uncharacterized repeat protein (TIGR03803 family)
LVQGIDGALYGTTYLGGSSANCSSGCGTVFKLCIPLAAPVNQILPTYLAGGNIVFTITSLAGWKYQLQSRDAVDIGNWSNVGSPVAGLGGPMSVTNATGPPVPHRFYRFAITP